LGRGRDSKQEEEEQVIQEQQQDHQRVKNAETKRRKIAHTSDVERVVRVEGLSVPRISRVLGFLQLSGENDRRLNLLLLLPPPPAFFFVPSPSALDPSSSPILSPILLQRLPEEALLISTPLISLLLLILLNQVNSLSLSLSHHALHCIELN
jgi:hypothetical protein